MSRFYAVSCYLLLLLLVGVAPAWAQDSDDEKGEEDGLILPAQGVGLFDLEKLADAEPSPPKTENCYVRGDGGALIAKVLCELGDERLVMLPTGQLEIVAMKDTRPTDKPFRSATREQIIRHYRQKEHFKEFEFVPAGYFIFGYAEGSEATYMQTRSILESLFAGMIPQLREWGLKPTRPQVPMMVLIMPSRAAFDALEPMPEGVAAYYSQIENHVVLYEDTRLREAAPEYAFKSASYTVAHEGIHQIMANTGVQKRLSSWPAWISEGLPEYFCPLHVNSRLIKNKEGELPERTLKWSRVGMVNDLRMRHLLMTGGRGGALVRDAISADSLTAYGYAVSWGLVHYFGERKTDEFAAYLRDVSKGETLMPIVEGGDTRADFSGNPDPLFIKHFGDDYPMLEARIQRHLNSKPIQKQYKDPYENQTVYLVTSTMKRGRVYETVLPRATMSPDEARKYKEELKARALAEGREAHVRLIVCDDLDEARYHIRKIMSRF